MMLMKKSGRKKAGICVILTVGALAAVGALAITKKGKEMMCMMKDKMMQMADKCVGKANGLGAMHSQGE